MSGNCHIKQQLVSEMEKKCVDMSLPNCHNVKTKLISRFASVRLQFFARKMRAVRKENMAKKKSGHEMSSKSMQMRKVWAR